MAIRFFGPSGGIVYGIDADVLLWKSAVESNGGSVTLTRLGIVNTFVVSEKDGGRWALTDDYWCLWGENAPQALTSLKQRRLATAVNSPTFVADRNYVFDGISNYINTGFDLSLNAVASTSTSLGATAYERTNVAVSGVFAIGIATGTNVALRLNPGNVSSQIVSFVNSSTVLTTASVGTSLGLSSSQRTGTTFVNYRTGLPITTTAPTTNGSVSPAGSLILGGSRESGTPTFFRACSLGFAAVHAALSDAQQLARYNAVQAWATSIGAQV